LKAAYDPTGIPVGGDPYPLSIHVPGSLPTGFTCDNKTETNLDLAEVDCQWQPPSSDVGVHDVTYTVTLPDGASGPSLMVHLARARYVALGDSYSSGEGVFFDNDGHPAPATTGLPAPPGSDAWYWDYPTDHDFASNAQDHCHRSPYAYSRDLAKGVDSTGAPLTPGPPNFHACSGALTSDYYSPNHEWSGGGAAPDQVPQLCWLELGAHDNCRPDIGTSYQPDTGVTLVTLTDGGNDIGFAPVVKNCVTTLWGDSGCWGQDRAINEAVKRLQPQILRLIGEIKSRAPAARILIGGYPKAFPSGGYPGACWTFTTTDEQWMNAKAAELNFAIQQAANESGLAEYVDAYSIDDTHEVCDQQAQWINGILPPPHPESFHPNILGHQAYANAFARQLRATRGVNYTINPEQSLDVAFNADPGGRATFSTSWPGSTIKVTLTSPDGQTFAGSDSAASVTHLQGPTFDVYRVNSPAGGTWTMHLTGVNVPPGGENVVVQTNQVPEGDAGSPIPPEATAAASSTHGTGPLTVTFTGSSGSQGVNYRWLFGDGSTAVGSSVHHTYEKPGTYEPALVAKGANGLESFVAPGLITVDPAGGDSQPSAEVGPKTSTGGGLAPITMIAVGLLTTLVLAGSIARKLGRLQ
jgi:PKD repeat protein/lysophospholipase L1-like esterase